MARRGEAGTATVDDQTLYERIWYGHRDGKIHVGTDLKVLNRPGSPAYRIQDNALPFFATVCFTLGAFMIGGWLLALGVLASCLILMLTLINFLIMGRVRERALDHAMSGMPAWQTLWDMGALSLLRDEPKKVEARSPTDEWRDFSRHHLRDIRVQRIPG